MKRYLRLSGRFFEHSCFVLTWTYSLPCQWKDRRHCVRSASDYLTLPRLPLHHSLHGPERLSCSLQQRLTALTSSIVWLAVGTSIGPTSIRPVSGWRR